MARYSRLDWTGSDFDSIRADLLARIASVFPDWTDTNPANPGMVLVDLLPYIGDLVRYYQDRQVNEAFLVTAVERANVIRHLKAIGYEMATASPASTPVTFTLSEAQDDPVVIEQGDKVQTTDGSVTFEVVERLEIAAGDTSIAGDVIEGETIDEDLGASDGSASQSFELGQVPFISGSEEVTVDGVAWTRVTNFLSSSASDQHYRVDIAPTGEQGEDRATIVFGDGTNGAIPTNGTLLAVSYRIGGGEVGNVEAGTITKLVRSYTTTAGDGVLLAATNAAAASGGEDRETLAHAKLYGPAALATGSRSVSRQDYETNAERVSGVARALAQTVEDDPVIPENTVVVQVVPTGSGTPSQTLLDEVTEQLTVTYPKPVTTRLMTVPATYQDIAPVGTVYVARGQSQQAVQQSRLEAVGDAVLEALETRYDAENIDTESGLHTADFGDRQALSTLYRTIDDTDGVKFSNLISPTGDLILSSKAFPRLRAYVKSVFSATEIRYTWTGLGTYLSVVEEP